MRQFLRLPTSIPTPSVNSLRIRSMARFSANRSWYCQTRNQERLAENLAIDRIRKEFTEGVGIDVGRRKNCLICVLPGAGKIVVIGQNVHLALCPGQGNE